MFILCPILSLSLCKCRRQYIDANHNFITTLYSCSTYNGYLKWLTSSTWQSKILAVCTISDTKTIMVTVVPSINWVISTVQVLNPNRSWVCTLFESEQIRIYLQHLPCSLNNTHCKLTLLSMPPYAKTLEERVKMWQRPIASDKVNLSLQMLPQRPAKNISTRPAVRESDRPPPVDTNLTVDDPTFLEQMGVKVKCIILFILLAITTLICKHRIIF